MARALPKPMPLEAVERRVERTLLDRERGGRGGVDPLGDLVAVLLAAGEGAQNQQLQCALEQVGGTGPFHKQLR